MKPTESLPAAWPRRGVDTAELLEATSLDNAKSSRLQRSLPVRAQVRERCPAGHGIHRKSLMRDLDMSKTWRENHFFQRIFDRRQEGTGRHKGGPLYQL